MSWKAYRLVYQAKSPIHIGWHTLGYIKLTRFYITGRAMWGAITANLARANGAGSFSEYKEYGNLLKSEILITYFYPALTPDNYLLPHFEERGMFYGNYFKADFERLFISSFGQTAVLPQSNTAEDESLHESEYISPTISEEGRYKPLFFVGYIFVKKGASLANGRKVDWINSEICLNSAIREIAVGGDLKYGWGRLKLFNTPEEEGHQKEIFGYNLDIDDTLPCFEIPKDSSIPAHLSVKSAVQLKGDIEPLLGREWGSSQDSKGKQINGAGQKISDAEICWMPGSIVEEDKGIKVILEVEKYGVLSAIKKRVEYE